MKIAFVSTSGMIGFTDRPKWTNGEVRDVKKARAQYLLDTHPDNFMTADDFENKTKQDKVAAAKVEDDKKNAHPRGHPSNPGDTTGSDTTGLTAEEHVLFESASKKIDEGNELTEAEQAVFDKVEAETSNDDGNQEGSDNG